LAIAASLVMAEEAKTAPKSEAAKTEAAKTEAPKAEVKPEVAAALAALKLVDAKAAEAAEKLVKEGKDVGKGLDELIKVATDAKVKEALEALKKVAVVEVKKS